MISRFFLIFLLVFPMLSIAQPTTVKQCQLIVDRIEQIREKRRHGGSSAYMNRLKKHKNDLDRKYSKLGCYRLKNHLVR